MPSRKFISTRVIPSIYNACLEKVQTLLEEADCMSLTADSWTSRATDNYITATLHVIDKQWNITNLVLGTDKFSLSHTIGNLAEYLTGLKEKWNLRCHGDGAIYVTTDNAANMVGGKLRKFCLLEICGDLTLFVQHQLLL